MQISQSQILAPVVRPASNDDTESIFNLMQAEVEKEMLLPRSIVDILTSLENFSVVDFNHQIIGCGALEVFTDELCEIRSLVVASDAKGLGYGKMIVNTLIGHATDLGFRRIMALTYVPDFFCKFGFKIVPKHIFPEKVWSVCYKCSKFYGCDEIAVLKEINN